MSDSTKTALLIALGVMVLALVCLLAILTGVSGYLYAQLAARPSTAAEAATATPAEALPTPSETPSPTMMPSPTLPPTPTLLPGPTATVPARPTLTPFFQGQPDGNRIDVSVDDDPFIGPEDAPVTVVEFGDFQCPYCKQFADETLRDLLEEYEGDIRFVYRDFPLSSIHPDAQRSAEAAECADEQGMFWEMHDAIFAQQPQGLSEEDLTLLAQDIGLDQDQFIDCLDSGLTTDEVLADYDDGLRYGVSGTPTFYINGIELVGAQPLREFEDIIDEELGR